MTDRLSESTYGFCVGSDIIRPYQINRTKFKVYLPSTLEEKIEGADFELLFNGNLMGSSLFLQFKIPDYIKHQSQKVPFKDIWTTRGGPYFRFELRKDDYFRQHVNLHNLSKVKKGFSFYSAPNIVNRDTFLKKFSKGKGMEMYGFFPVSRMKINAPILPGDRHFVSFDSTTEKWDFHTEYNKNDYDILKWDDVFESIVDAREDPNRKNWHSDVSDVLKEILPHSFNASNFIEQISDSDRKYSLASHLLREVCNVHWFVIVEEGQNLR